jgi:hypothetical protein
LSPEGRLRVSANSRVRILPKKGGHIAISPFDPQPEPENLISLKGEVGRRWPATSPLDILKETDLRVGFTQAFQGPTLTNQQRTAGKRFLRNFTDDDIQDVRRCYGK